MRFAHLSVCLFFQLISLELTYVMLDWKMQHHIFIFFLIIGCCHHHLNLFFLFILLIYFVLMWLHGTAGVGLSTPAGFCSDLSWWIGVLSWGAGRAGAHSRLPHCWPEQPVSKLLWNEEREDWSEAEARTTGRRRAIRETNSKFESIHLKGCSSVKVLLSAVATVWCLKGFCRDQGVADVDWKKEEGGREMGKQSNGGKTNRINRGIKEILIWSKRLLIFFLWSGHVHKVCYWFWNKECSFKSCWLCVFFFVSVWIYSLCLLHYCHICVCIYSQSCQLEGWVCGLKPLASQRCWD